MIPVDSRVRLIRRSERGPEIPEGSTGTLLVHYNAQVAGVEWDLPVPNHAGHRLLMNGHIQTRPERPCKPGHGYWVFTKDIESINQQLDLFNKE
jgi:hypothetical protein